jgi:hypothetical protein
VLAPSSFVCPHCAQINDTAVDLSQGARQTYGEDCQVCCRPLMLQVHVEDGEAWVDAVPEVD